MLGARKITRSTKISSVACPNCHSANAVQLNVLFKYLHFFFIPCLPLSKIGSGVCTHCGQVLQPHMMPEPMRNELQVLLKSRPIPLWSFVGLALFIGLIVFGENQEKKVKKDTAVFILDPKKGDILTIKLFKDEFSLLKIDSIRDDSLYLTMSNYVSEKEYQAINIKRKGDRAFGGDQMKITKERLKELYADSIIVEARR